jgi:type 1 fimbria pilin
MNFVGGVAGGGVTNGVLCSPMAQQPRWQTFVNQIPYGGQTLLDVGVPGVALRLKATGLSTGNFPRVQSANNGCTNNGLQSYWCITSWGTGRQLELVKIANVTGSGAMNSGAEVLRMDYATDSLIVTGVFIGASSSVTTVACSVTTPAINVSLGRVFLTDFNGTTKGSTSPEVPFEIGLDCNPNARVNVRLDATADSSAAPGVIGLSPVTNAATGVGVQILRDSTPLTFGSSSLIGTATVAGAFKIPFTARYYQTGNSVRGGIANASATFTMTYQ